MKFFHLPISNDPTPLHNDWTVERFLAYLPSLRAAEQEGPTISHCDRY